MDDVIFHSIEEVVVIHEKMIDVGGGSFYRRNRFMVSEKGGGLLDNAKEKKE